MGEEQHRDTESPASKSKTKIDLRDFVKQDFKGIVTSLDYFDEEKYEGGKRIKKTKKAKEVVKVAEQSVSESTQENAEEKTEDKAEESEDNKTLSEETSSKRKKSSETKSPKKVKTASGTFK